MLKIKVSDLEILRQEQAMAKLAEQSTVRAVVQLSVENKKKDLLIQQLAQTINTLAIEIAKLEQGKGGDE